MKFFTAATAFLGLAISSIQVFASPIESSASLELANVIEKRSICTTPTGSCTFYKTCLENKYKCGNGGYPLNYGFKYCRAFEDARPNFSTAGKKWIDATMKCLQKKLVKHTSGSTCTKIKSAAFASHSDCYVDNGLCTLGPLDLARIVSTVDLADMFGGKANLVEVLQSMVGCAAKIFILV